jgi:outer membrane protein TolC
LNWVIFNGLTNYYTIDEAAASLRGARATRTEVEEQVWLNVRTAYDYADAELTLVQARSDYVQARADYDTAIASLWQAEGVVWTGRAP